MFWKYNFSSSAQIETLLQKEDVTLFELMDEDELLQECKAQNRKLIDFLTRAEVLDEMVYLVVNEPAAEGEMQMRFKYANLAAELLTADVPAIIDKLVASTSLLDILYKFLEKEKPLNPLLASFFSKVLGMLVQRRSEQNWYSYQFTCFQVLDFLKSKGDFVELAVQHVGTSAIMDLLLKLICNVEEDEIRQSVHQWLNEGQLVERLVDKLSPDADPEDHSSADNLLCEISTSCRDTSTDGHQQTNPLLATLESEDTVNKLLDLLLHEDRNDSSLSHVINILLTLLSARTQQQQIQHQQQQQQGLQQSASVDSSDSESSDGRKNAVARIIAKRLPSLQNILLHPPKKGLLLTAYGQEVEPLGNTRLQVVTLVAALVVVNDPVVHNSLYELNTVEYLLDLFFKFMLNNFLHTQVEQCLTAILTKAPAAASPEGDTDHRLLTQLFNEGRIIERVVEAFDESSERQECKQIHNLKGYMGHLRQLSNTIVQQAEFGPNEHRIKQLIQGLPGDKATQWDDFVSNALAELNRKNEITPLPWIHMLSGNTTAGEHDWGLATVEADETDESPQVLEEKQEEREEENEVEEKWTQKPDHGFKEMDMDVIGDFRYADDEFKDPDDNLSGPLQRLTTQALALSGASGLGSGAPAAGQAVDGGGEAGVGEDHDLFEEMCSNRLHHMNEFDDMWNDKEKEITFNQEAVLAENNAKEKESCSSSDDEDEEEGIRGLSSGETKMEVDPDDWAEVFDKRGSGGENGGDEPVNPWQSAPMSDTSENSGWADFGGSGFSGSGPADCFAQPIHKAETFTADFSSNFGSTVTQENSSTPAVFGETAASNQEAFKADFSNINFDAGFEANCDDKSAVTSTGDPQNSFLSSRGLMKMSGENAGISEAGTTHAIPSENDEQTSGPPSPPQEETIPEPTAQN
ncbi:serine/threonine-protein phosphatase 6 regulatory subunit 3-like isoform X1 [Penaeus chinensis]|uniref:serine/threonine-protein phosphatase 6 regulatory subunit 3-like isoform X1 n=1 Tax=Penaeus chinensis TaxID=139456 RepID=UPI001FB78BFB|nr:serine/threonine-protein phosphatase 6 regulatory subunit 3-like isoform X1 [Penaeus chinensis]XP_047486747.1 serine/threonine-protein phosphatase 6 regulatory subunit 3-like isoform X1 [Penaeus chinensis]XP_047486748.1 serine/threonine-protein phosphatase 6 regulatory subunit 3-like isoform X1 [Penaeus chinensis]XP_047486749.1 serine/threonine-protein phosphatase 6 regulatory subunit 3-like isoform X1 [Penaeus chinensis]